MKKMTDNRRKRYGVAIMYVVTFILVTYLCYIFPYTGDDWAWGSQIGIDRLELWFDKYNGRYAGNLLVLVLTRAKLVKAIFESLSLLAIVYLVVPNKNNRFFNTLVGILLIVAAPKLILRQSIVWTAGFSNYVISIAFVLIYVRYCYQLTKTDHVGDLKVNNYLSVPMLVLAFVSALFVEHITIYIVVMSIVVILYSFCKFHKVFLVQIGYCVGAILGAVCMFSNGAYRAIASNEDAYRTIEAGDSVFSRMLNNFLDVIGKELFFYNLLQNILIGIVVLILMVKYRDRLSSGINKISAYISSILIGCTCVYSVIINLVRIFLHKEIVGEKTYALVTILFCLSLVVFCLSAVPEKNLQHRLIFIVGSIACMTGPLLLVTPIGSRCFFPSYVMFIFFITEGFSVIKMPKWLNAIVLAAILLAFVNLFRIYIPIHQADEDRLAQVRDEVKKGATEIEISHLPYGNYLWCAEPKTETIWEERYKLFYDIPAEIKLIDVEQKEG